MEPDYLRHAQEIIERLRLSKPLPKQAPVESPRQIVIHAPRGCVFYIGTAAAPSPPPESP